MSMKYSRFNHIVPVPDSYDHAIMNYRTGVVARLDPFQKKLFDLAMQLPEDNPLILSWKNAGFLTGTDDIQDIRDDLKEHYRIYEARTDKVFRLTLYVTSACNFSCPYCFQERRGGSMSREVQDAVVRFARSKLSTGQFQKMTVGWFGGEPLLASGVIERLGSQLMDAAAEYKAVFASKIITNGYLLDQDMVDLLERVNCYFAKITIDGVGDDHDKTRPLRSGGGTYDAIIRNLSGIRTSMRLNIRTNLTASNYSSYNELCQVIRGIAQKTGNHIICSPERVNDNPASEKRGYAAERISPELYKQLLDKAGQTSRPNAYGKKVGCCHITSPNYYTVDERGYVYPHCYDDSMVASCSYGSILDYDKTGFEKLDKKHLEFCRREILPERYPKCMACKLLPVCYGGCPAKRISGAKEPECPPQLTDPDAYVLRRYYEMRKSSV